MITKVYKYGLLPPTKETSERVRAEMLRGHRLRNDNIQIERGRRAAVRAIEARFDDIRAIQDRVNDAERVVQAAVEEIRKYRVATGKRAYPQEIRDRLQLARSKKAEALRELRQKRAERHGDVEAQREADRVNELASDLEKDAYQLSGTYIETRRIVRDAMGLVRKMPLFDGEKPNDPDFKRWRGEGQLGVQVHAKGEASDGFTPGELDQNGWIEIVRSVAVTGRERRRGGRTTLRLRIGSEGRDPIWGEWIMVMHRPLPEGAKVRRATVTCRKRGPREEWSVELTVRLEKDDRQVPETGTLAIDLGWRLFDDGSVRVCAWRDTEGQRGELRLSAWEISGLRKADELQGVRDKEFNAARDKLVVWSRDSLLKDAKLGVGAAPGFNEATESSAYFNLGESEEGIASDIADRTNDRSDKWDHVNSTLDPMYDATVHGTQNAVGAAIRPDWFIKETASLALWKSSGRLAALALRWRENRFLGDNDAYDTLEAWRYHDHHLWTWQEAQRIKALRRRKDTYRKFAATLAKKYRSLVLEDFDLSAVQRRPAVDSEEHRNMTASRNRKDAAPGELRMCLEQAFGKERVAKIDPKNTSRICSVCGTISDEGSPEDVMRTCPGCNRSADQDDDACLVLLARHAIQQRAEKSTATAPVESKWERVARLRKAKEARLSGSAEVG